MTERDFSLLKFEVEDSVARVTLNRPEIRNALNPALLEEIRRAFEEISSLAPEHVRVVVLAGEGKAFCAGADVNWMRESLGYDSSTNIADALRMAQTFDAINTCPVPVIARVQGASLGGGIGLIAVCDIVVLAQGTTLGLTEVKLGIAPAVISPYVLAKIGRGHARALALTGERFGAERAVAIGLAHVMVPEDELDAEITRIVGEVLGSSPQGIRRMKQLIATVPSLTPDEAMQLTAETIAALRVSDEGQEGLTAFLEKRKPRWAR
jgi:methylglutaconyl-CoA hydratase